MNVNVDARGKACPQPVVMAKKALDSIKTGQVVVIVDNEISRDNVTKFATSMGFNCEVKEKDKNFEIIIAKCGQTDESTVPEDIAAKCDLKAQEEYVVLISGDTFGSGEEELGKLLLRNYLYTLRDGDKLPVAVLFVNSGVFLTTDGSDCIDELKELEASGVEVLSCGTCLDYYNLKDKLMVGKVTNMYEIVEMTTKSRTVSL
jgi:selenium metabolism protein YedF